MLKVIEKSEATIDSLADMLKRAKEAEKKATEKRREVEDIIIKAIGKKDEGSFTAKGENFSLTTTGKLTRTLDANGVQHLHGEIPEPIFERLFNYKPSLNFTELKYIQNNEPEYYNAVAQVITTKPAKTAVGFKELGE